MTTPGPGPRSGDDTYALIDDALAALAGRRGAWPGDDLTAITLIASLIDHTWDQIAAALATSPEQAQLRYGDDSPVADTRRPCDLQPHSARPPQQDDAFLAPCQPAGSNRRRGRPPAMDQRTRAPTRNPT